MAECEDYRAGAPRVISYGAAGVDPGAGAADRIWGHCGFIGTGMCIPPKLGTWALLLTNKLYCTRDCESLTSIRNGFCVLVFNWPRTQREWVRTWASHAC
ncbi:hypothetical protein ACIF9R_02360 [Streptomyces sp. NPDC086080]|uniref:hypothetical protein n=1 Tax=Streptomyces sp. NPDC086080 TaxID=3365748 RepID=UPI0037D625DD